MQPGVLFLSNAGSPYRGLPQDDTSFITKFLGFASPPHDGFADKYSIVTKENLQAVYATLLLCTFIIHAAKLLVKCFSKIFVVTLNEKEFAAETLHRVYVFLKRVNSVRKLETHSERSVIKPHAEPLANHFPPFKSAVIIFVDFIRNRSAVILLP